MTIQSPAPLSKSEAYPWADEFSGQPRLICALGISHRDVGLAIEWLRWTSFLASRDGGAQHDSTLLIAGTQRITPQQWADLRAAVQQSPGMFKVEGYVLPDEEESSGYPKSASHLFLRTLEYCEATYPDQPVLWVESDSVPMRPGWFTEIEREYWTCGKPFMGHLEGITTLKHMAGVGVYPANWRELAPRLANVLSAPDTPAWGAGKGQAFDTYGAPEVVPQMAQAKSIQQIWRPKTFTAVPPAIRPSTALFHQCKDGSLIAVLSRQYPDFVPAALVETEALFAVRGHHLTKVLIGHEIFAVKDRLVRLAGGWWSIIRPTTATDLRKLESLVATGEVERVTKSGLEAEAAKVQKMRIAQRV